MSQREELEKLIKTINEKGMDENFVREALYTAEETGIIDFRIDSDLAVLIWKIVEYSFFVEKGDTNRIKM